MKIPYILVIGKITKKLNLRIRELVNENIVFAAFQCEGAMPVFNLHISYIWVLKSMKLVLCQLYQFKEFG